MNTISNLLIRPKRDSYDISDLGSSSFMINERFIQRKDFVLKGSRGAMQCSWYVPSEGIRCPCIIYCHGNSGSRRDALEIRNHVLAFDYSLMTFDFGGCGQSHGDYVSLGYLEKEDLGVVVQFLQKSGRVSSIGLWGRSMGSVAVMLYISENPGFPVVVLDSPFCRLVDVVNDQIAKVRIVPERLRNLLFNKICDHILDTIEFDLRLLQPINKINGSYTPAVIIHSQEDTLVSSKHALEIFRAFQGPKFIMETSGNHNAARDPGLTLRILNILEFFIQQSPKIEDVNLTAKGALPDLSENTKNRIRRKQNY